MNSTQYMLIEQLYSGINEQVLCIYTYNIKSKKPTSYFHRMFWIALNPFSVEKGF